MADVRLPDIVSRVRVDPKDVNASLNRISSSVSGTGGKFGALQQSVTSAVDSISSSLTSQLGPAGGKAQSVLDNLAASGSLMGPAVAGGTAPRSPARAHASGEDRHVVVRGTVITCGPDAGASPGDERGPPSAPSGAGLGYSSESVALAFTPGPQVMTAGGPRYRQGPAG